MNKIDQNPGINSNQSVDVDENSHQLLESRVDEIGRIYLKQQTPDGTILVRILDLDNSIRVLSSNNEFEAVDTNNQYQLLECFISKIGGIFLKQRTPEGIIIDRYLGLNNTLYIGQFEKWQGHGQGKLITAKGEVYEGQFKNWNPHGQGKLIKSDGGVYQGQFEYGQIQGMGTLIEADGFIYKGQFEDGIPHGWGKAILPDGFVYEGQYEQGEAHGIHVRSKKNLPSQMAEFQNGAQMEDWRLEQGLSA
ncbi:MAG: hypothetical protein JSS30_05710 [Verrucomicrobia bacterium]|nr:hypothetical protein [Verrucomicrobiota bacterium]